MQQRHGEFYISEGYRGLGSLRELINNFSEMSSAAVLIQHMHGGRARLSYFNFSKGLFNSTEFAYCSIE